MPTPDQAFAVVAQALGGIDPEDRDAVHHFYRHQFAGYPPAVQTLISDFLIGQTGVPSSASLQALKRAVAPAGLRPEPPTAAPLDENGVLTKPKRKRADEPQLHQASQWGSGATAASHEPAS